MIVVEVLIISMSDHSFRHENCMTNELTRIMMLIRCPIPLRDALLFKIECLYLNLTLSLQKMCFFFGSRHAAKGISPTSVYIHSPRVKGFPPPRQDVCSFPAEEFVLSQG